MADEKVIVAGEVTVKTSEATANVKTLNKELANTDTALKNVSKTSKETSESVKTSGTHFSKLKESVEGLPGPFKATGEAAGGLDKVFKTLLANPVVLVITAIVAALAFLYKSFTNTASGGEKMEQTFAGIKAAAKAVLDAIFELGGAIIKFFSGDFKGAFEDAKHAVTGVVDAVTNAYTVTAKLTAQLQQINKDQAANDIDQAKRAKDLAILREQATDESIPIAKRKAALLELQKAAKADAILDVDLAKRTAETKIALLSIGTDAAKKNYKEIADLRIKQIQVETDAANEQRRIGKQITAADKQEKAEQTAAAKEAAEKQKQIREQLEAFNTQLTKLRQQNALAGITDQYEKEKQLLENKIQDEENLIKKQFTDGKITRAQFNTLQAAEAENAAIQRKALTDKHNKDIADQEEKFQKQLADLRTKTRVDGITDAREKEQVQLEISHEQELQQAIKDYGVNSEKFFQIKQAIDADFKAKQDALTEKNRIADAQKALREAEKHLQNQLTDPALSFKGKQEAIDAEQKQVEDAFKNKILTEEQYNDDIAKLAAARVDIKQKELAEQQQAASATVDLIEGISEAVGKNTAAGKALAIAAATIKALQAEVTIIAGLSEVGPFGFIAGIAAAAAVGVGLFNTIKQIESVPVPGQSNGSSRIPSPVSIAAPVSPQQASTKLPQDQINQIGSKVQPVRAYVVQSDSAREATRQARLEGQSVLGGH